MSEWQTTTLGEFVSLRRGHDLPTKNRTPGNVPVIGSGGLNGWHNEAKAHGPGVTIGRAANLGEPQFIQSDFWPLNTTLYVTDLKGNDVKFVYNLFKSIDLTGFNSGSVQPMLNRNYIQNFPIIIPPPEEQRSISSALGALDDKIAVNEHIASTAIALADSLFASETGGVDFGEDTFGSVARVAGGGTPKTKEDDYWGGDIAWATPKDLTALGPPYLFETSRNITRLGLENCASELYPAQSIFMTSRATIGAFALPQIPAAVNQGFIVVLPPTEDLRWWLFHEMRSRVDEMLSLANGSTFLELSRKNFKAMPVRLPKPEVLQRFSSRVKPLHEGARNAASESRKLAELRDTLLPQLMSGKLRVKDAEKIVEDNV